MEYSAIDLHSSNCSVTVVDGNDKAVAEMRPHSASMMVVEFQMPWHTELRA